VTLADPLYCEEYVDGAVDVMSRFLTPALFAAEHLDGGAVASILAPFKGHRMAKAALEMAVLDAELKAEGRPLARELGAVHDRVPCGVSVGIMDSVPALLAAVHSYLEQGYQRIKLKIEPGWDVEPVRAVRGRFGNDLLLQVDANTAYTLADAPHLVRLDPFDLLLIEQPSKRTTSSATPSWPNNCAPRCAWTSRSPPPAPPQQRSHWAPARWSTSSPAGSVVTSRPVEFTICAWLTA